MTSCKCFLPGLNQPKRSHDSKVSQSSVAAEVEDTAVDSEAVFVGVFAAVAMVVVADMVEDMVGAAVELIVDVVATEVVVVMAAVVGAEVGMAAIEVDMVAAVEWAEVLPEAVPVLAVEVVDLVAVVGLLMAGEVMVVAVVDLEVVVVSVVAEELLAVTAVELDVAEEGWATTTLPEMEESLGVGATASVTAEILARRVLAEVEGFLEAEALVRVKLVLD